MNEPEQIRTEEKKPVLRSPIVLAAAVLLVLVIVYALYTVLVEVGERRKQVQSRLTDEERTAILNSLSQSSEAKPLTDEEKSAILDSLKEDSKTTLSDEEKQAILDSLQ
jgi:uncharacterized membrane protein YvbJ